MFHTTRTRLGRLMPLGLVLAIALAAPSCGGGDASTAPRPMVLTKFLFLDRALSPTAPTGTESLPRNAILGFVFSEIVDPLSISNQTIEIRFGPTGQSVPQGSFSVNGNMVLFDPTVTAQGQPNPLGLEAQQPFTVDIPSYQDQPSVVRNYANDPNLVSFFTTFRTSTGYLRELIPPTVLDVYFIPDPAEVNPITLQVPGNGIMGIRFSEPMDPATFILAGPGDPNGLTNINASVDVRYKPDSQINVDNGLVDTDPVTGQLYGKPIPGFWTWNAGLTDFFFNPTFSFGDNKYKFDVRVRQGLKDLSGNQLVNPRSFPGPDGFTSDGNGQSTGFFLFEGFDSVVDLDFQNTDADWGVSTPSMLQGAPITTRNAYVFGYQFHKSGAWGQYFASANPLIGAQLNNVPGIPAPNPPTAAGRRVLLSFSDTEMGASGAITGARWGPDSNATFSAIYPEIFLRAGIQKQKSMNLSSTFQGNYEGQPTVVYTGSYSVNQAANVGNAPGHPPQGCASATSGPCPDHNAEGSYQQGFGCTSYSPWNEKLFIYTGFASWPQFTTFYEWQDRNPTIPGDRVFLWDMSVREGDTWQQIRGWFAFPYPCAGWNAIPPIAGFPNRTLYSVFEGEDPNPIGTFANGLFNPEPSVLDTCFTITKRQSIAQVLWYTDGMQPANSTQTISFQNKNNFLTPQINPQIQAGGTQARIQFQACNGVENDRRTVNRSLPFLDLNGDGEIDESDWTDDVNDCDGYFNLRWRIILVSNISSLTRPYAFDVAIPFVSK